MLAIKKDIPIIGEDGFSGAISLPLLPDLIQIYTVSLADGALTIRSGVQRGTVWFEHGEIVHAECGGLTGEEAVYQLLRWEAGQFTHDPEARASVRTIAVPWQNVLMEGCRRLDEDSAAGPRMRVSNALRELAESLEGVRAAAVFDAEGGLVAQRTTGGTDLTSIGPLLVNMLRAQAQATQASLRTHAPLVDCFSVLGDQEHLLVPLAGGGLLQLLLARDAVNLAVVRRAIARVVSRLE